MKLHSLYDRLSPEERFRAATAALARRDGEELDRLNDSAPMRAIRVQEPGYFARLRELWFLATMHSSACRGLYLAATTGLMLVLALSDEEIDETKEAALVDDSDAPNEPSSASLDTLIEAASIALARVRGKERAWEAFCKGLELDPAEVRRAFVVQEREALEHFAHLFVGSEELAAIEQSEFDCWLDLLRHCWSQSITQQYRNLEL